MHKVGDPLVLVILDGFGYRAEKIGNAVAQASMPTWERLVGEFPAHLLHASGPYVGLVPGIMGNSQVGHLTLGAGRVVASRIAQVVHEVDQDILLEQEPGASLVLHMGRSGKTVHLIGLISDGGVHSSVQYLVPLFRRLRTAGCQRLVLHAILDGRDTPPRSAGQHLAALQPVLHEYGVVLGSLHGRAYAMDRDEHWERTDATMAVLWGTGKHEAMGWQQVVHHAYEQDTTDEFVHPVLLDSRAALQQGDAALVFNIRPDRVRQLLVRLCADALLPLVASMASVSPELQAHGVQRLYPETEVHETFLDVFAAQTQGAIPVFLIAEHEKEAHVTYFFRGMSHRHLPHEQRIMVPSLGSLHYQTTPAMSAFAITQAVADVLHKQSHAVVVVNYANADMVGHTGDLQATIQACQVLDQQLARLYEQVVVQRQGTLVITADHGKAEAMVKAGQPLTAHTTNPVPLVWVHESLRNATVYNPFTQEPQRGLAAVAPTLLTWLGLAVPAGMESPLML